MTWASSEPFLSENHPSFPIQEPEKIYEIRRKFHENRSYEKAEGHRALLQRKRSPGGSLHPRYEAETAAAGIRRKISAALPAMRMRSAERWAQSEVRKQRKSFLPRNEPCRNPKTVWLNWTDCSSVFMRIWSMESCPKLAFRCCLMIMSRSRQT